jgi:hypothetical protein
MLRPAIERAASAHSGKPWSATGFADIGEAVARYR